VYDDSVRPSQRTQCTSIIKTNSLMLYRKNLVAYCENNMKHNRLCEQKADFLMVNLEAHVPIISLLMVKYFLLTSISELSQHITVVLSV
jgi:hypothetical protein